MPEDQLGGTAGVVGKAEPEERVSDLRWSVHPLRAGGWRPALAVGSIALFTVATFSATGSIEWALFAALVLFLSLSRYFLSTVYTLSEAGVEARYPTGVVRRPWSAFSSFQVERNGVFLSPYARPSRRENFRGLFLLAGENRKEVAEFVRKRVEGRQP